MLWLANRKKVEAFWSGWAVSTRNLIYNWRHSSCLLGKELFCDYIIHILEPFKCVQLVSAHTHTHTLYCMHLCGGAHTPVRAGSLLNRKKEGGEKKSLIFWLASIQILLSSRQLKVRPRCFPVSLHLNLNARAYPLGSIFNKGGCSSAGAPCL